ncbi:MAG: serine O-acetyltransferase [Pseudomonadales bacterium]|jgi:serine O-acetyltransferase|uniref:serine O-acetyltransferase n=1 Tax=unclassified Ketobacter TaxID=2639109 RepID=UPI000C8B17D8|nr:MULTISPECIES: serine O-acetyltransferase [unclassified Ketobacter]MAQ26956.1 serine O-acetyltransferase [Pseudomonadales bacterium]MEC8811703.1 serine O-acetyltransferase [Pseudomonadota bacterium]TNC84532.1 MAG: serine O-acetyltransferase [Alcanivorax sp.]HAG95687.1 serine O-acetyltransferase [Gammaproteobacteria bacterium]RLT91904.1 MAG: serine O-acetyltransferase [Ketobacter sp. GenoA1]
MSNPASDRISTVSTSKGLWAQWRDDIASVFQRDPAARNVLEVLTTYPGVHAVMIHRVSSRLWLRGWRYPARFLSFLGRLLSNVDIHPGARIGERFFIDHGAGVVVGETAVVGNDVTLYHGVTLGGTSWNKGKRHPTLGDGVMVGAGAKILGNITVGNHCRVGANSVVVEDVPDSCTVVGIPGKVVKLREAGQLNPYGIDLDHHLIPDPVGKAIACLLSRIDVLEMQLKTGLAATGYASCETDNQVCESDCPGGQVERALKQV